MDNSYFLLRGRDYEMLRLSFSSLYRLNFDGVYDACRIDRGDGHESACVMLDLFDRVITKGGWTAKNVETIRMFISLNSGGMVRFAKGFRGLGVKEFPSCRCVGVKYGEGKEGACSFGKGISMGKHWSNVLGDLLIDLDMFGKAFAEVEMGSLYELVVDYVYFCLVHIKGIGERLELLDSYRGIKFIEGFDAGIGCMFLRYYEWVSDDPDWYKSSVTELVRYYKGGQAGRGFELFQEEIRDWSRNKRGMLECNYVKTEEFRFEFINANLYGIRVMLEAEGKRGVKDREYIDGAYYGIGKVVKRDVKKDLKIVGRFIEYVLSVCYVA